jgi:hypothetical protein
VSLTHVHLTLKRIRVLRDDCCYILTHNDSYIEPTMFAVQQAFTIHLIREIPTYRDTSPAGL